MSDDRIFESPRCIGEIPGYATHMGEVSKAAKYLKYGGCIGIALTGTASAMKVQEVCRTGLRP